MRGKAAPPDKDFWYAAERSYQLNPNPILDGFQLIKHSPTLSVWKEGNRFLIGIRGTNIKDLGDIDADISLVMNKLTKTGRYKKDKKMLEDLFRQYPPAQNEFYLAAHSLSGAISNQLKAEFPFIREAVEFNPAFQPVDFLRRRGDIKRYYIDSDPLYKLGGRFLANTKVYPAGQTSNNIIADALSGHKLSNFKPIVGGDMQPGVIRRRERVTTEEELELMRAEQDEQVANEIINYVANNPETIFTALSSPFSALFRYGRRYLIECLTNYFTRTGLSTRLRGIVKRFLLAVIKLVRRMRGSGIHRENFLKAHNLPKKAYSLKKLSEISYVPLDILQEVYNRGIGAYKTNPSSVRLKGSYVKGVNAPASKKLSKEQWAMARVYSFLDGNPKHDNDLRRSGGRKGETPTPPRRVPPITELFGLLGIAFELDHLYPNRFVTRYLDQVNELLREAREGDPILLSIYDTLVDIIERLRQVARDPRKY